MKITIVLGAFLPVPAVKGGAVEKRWHALAKEFAALGHEVVLIARSWKDMKKAEFTDGIQFKRTKGYDTPSAGWKIKLYDLLYAIRAKKLIPPDSGVIITNTFWLPILLSSRDKLKNLVDVARMPKGQMKFYTKSRFLRANSNVVASAIKSEIDVKYHSKVVMIPNPLPFSGSETVNSSNKQKTILYVGRVHPEKGIELLLRSLDAIDDGWKVQIIGPWEVQAGGGGESYFSQLKRINSRVSIEFTGPVYDMDVLASYYKAASIFVYPSLAEKGETFGLAPLEAMSYGCIPIVSDLDCFKDFIVDGKNGIIFNHRSADASVKLSDSILRLQHDEKLRTALIKEAVKVNESHSTQKIANSFLETFLSINNGTESSI